MSARKAKQVSSRSAKDEKVKVNVRVKKSAPKTKASAKATVKPRVSTQKEKQTRIEIMQTLADKTNMTRVQIENVFDELNNVIAAHISKRGSGEITIPKTGIKIRRVKKKASKSRKMVSPLSGKEFVIAAKPSRYAVKLSALKPLKEIVER